MSSLITVCVADGIVSYEGQKTYERCIDPIEGPNRNHSIVAKWEFDGQKLSISSDRLGLIPIFIYQYRNRISVSDDLAKLMRVVPCQQVDFPALSVFLRLGYFVGNDTPFEHVSTLPAATTINWRGEKLSLNNEAYTTPLERIRSREAAVMEYVRLFRSSVTQRILENQRIALPLSGGRDSRHILMELARAGCLPSETITARAPGGGNGEVHVASLLANHFKVNNKIVELDYSRWVNRELEKNVVTHCLSDQHAWYLYIEEALDSDTTTVFDGLGGDVLSNGLFFDTDLMIALEDGRVEDAAKALLSSSECPYLCKDLRAQLSCDVAVTRLAKELSRHIMMPDPVKSFFFWNRTRRAIALCPICIGGRRRQLCFPYLDSRLFEFLMGLPWRTFGRPGFHDEAIDRSGLIGIPYAGKVPDRLGRREQVQMIFAALNFLRSQGALRYANLRFVLPRIARIISSGVSQDFWWVNMLVFFESLRSCCGGRLDLGSEMNHRSGGNIWRRTDLL